MSLAKNSTPLAGRSTREATAAAASTTWLTASSAGLVVGLDPYLQPYHEFQVRVVCSQCYLSYLSCLSLPSLPPFTATFVPPPRTRLPASSLLPFTPFLSPRRIPHLRPSLHLPSQSSRSPPSLPHLPMLTIFSLFSKQSPPTSLLSFLLPVLASLFINNSMRSALTTNHYPHFRALLAGGTRLAYGVHALTDGRLQSLPRLDFQDGAVVEWVILPSIACLDSAFERTFLGG
ncbi:hypothetical protein K438DRAFT_1856719 [Mycena galopus ATCC 62051]|nr:hypothetical protein K438DRAFT_1856719 [Mycena galopus ATCC 62051]